MKRNFLTLFAVALMVFAGCSEKFDEGNGNNGDDKKPATEFTLEASTESVVLDPSKESATAVTFTWTTGSNFGTGSAIEYVWEIAAADSEYEDGYKEELGRNITSKTFAVGELNNYLRTNLLAMDGEEETYKVRVSAIVAGSDVEQADEVTFTATTYEPFTGELYMIGSATTGGWSLDNATALTLEGNGVFTYTGRLNSGDFKFVTSKQDFWPGYVRDGSADNEWTMKYFAAQPTDEEDLKFELKNGGTYTITADVINLTVKVDESEAILPAFSSLFFVSEGHDWSFQPMYQSATDPFIFRYNGTINAGDFKFGTAEGSWENMYKAPSEEEGSLDFENSDKTWETSATFVAGFDPDYKWKINDTQGGKAYKIYLNITDGEETMKIWQFEPYEHIWLVGSATTLGWSLDDIEASTAQTMTLKDPANPYVFTWTGTLNDGELKFSCDLKKDWNGYWIKATKADEPFSGLNNAPCILETGGNDYKWKVTAGTYTITIDTLNETITIG